MQYFFLFRDLFGAGGPVRWRAALAALLSWCALPALAQFSVSGLAPARNARSAARSTNVALTFSQSVNAATAGNVRVFSQQRGGQLVRGGNATASGSTLTVDPATDLRPGETVYTTVPATVTSMPHVYQFTAAAGAGPGIFGGGSDPAVGRSPQSVTVGAVDGDGDLDLLTANSHGNTVSVRLNNGSGTTAAANGTGMGPFSATISGLTPGTTYYVQAYATNSYGTSYGGVQTFATAAQAVTAVSWTGSVSTDWFTAANWSPGQVPDATIDVTIPTAPSGNRFPVIGANAAQATAKNVGIATGASLNMSANTLTLAGNQTTNGAFNGFTGSGGTATGGTVAVGGSALALLNGGGVNSF